MELEFKNLIDSKTGETVKLEVPDDFDTAPMEEWGRRGRESAERFKKAFAKGMVEDQEDLDAAFAEDMDEHYWDLI